mmetsp:Transcript_132110/g.263632  ORF Transcript_132110/g.263632 Transcript_132110/m.263632 type:complete len:204 (+) Transcript_132110:485-1096(+)
MLPKLCLQADNFRHNTSCLLAGGLDDSPLCLHGCCLTLRNTPAHGCDCISLCDPCLSCKLFLVLAARAPANISKSVAVTDDHQFIVQVRHTDIGWVPRGKTYLKPASRHTSRRCTQNAWLNNLKPAWFPDHVFIYAKSDPHAEQSTSVWGNGDLWCRHKLHAKQSTMSRHPRPKTGLAACVRYLHAPFTLQLRKVCHRICVLP